MAGTSYTRQSTLTDGDTITASLFNAEYNQLVTAFSYAATGTTGHQHDGGAGEGGNIEIIGDQDFLNKIVVDSTNNRWSVFVEVGGSAVEQVRIQDGVVYPVTDSDVDLGTDALRFKNAYIDSLTATGNLIVGGTVDGVDIASRDGVLSSTTTTASAALPKAGGAMTGAITTNSTFDGRDVATDGTKLDGIEASADVTDATNVTAAGALMDSELTAIASVKALNQGVATGDSPTFVDVTATSLDISGDVDVDGTLETDALTIAGVTLAETIADTVGAMVSSNTESGIAVAYQDADNTLDFTVGTLNQNTTGSAATLTTPRAIAVAGDVTGTANFDGSAAISITTTLATDAIVTANITNANVTLAKMATNSVDSGQYVDGSIDTAHIADDAVTSAKLDTNIAIGGTLGVTGVLTGASLDISGDIDVDGTTNLDVVDIDGAVDMATTLQVDGVATFTGRDVHSGGITIANAGQIGSVGDADAIAIASDGVVTLTQKLIGTELDISGNIDVDGTTNLDVVDIDGAVDMASTLAVAGVAVFSAGITEDAVTLSGTSTTIDISAATNFVHDLTGATTYTFSNPASDGNASSFTLKIIQGSTARAITWPNTVDWAGGTAPTLSSADNAVDVFVFYTIDGGTTYYGFTAGQAMA